MCYFSVVCIFELFMWCWLCVVSVVNMWYANSISVVVWGMYGVRAIWGVCVSCIFHLCNSCFVCIVCGICVL